LKQLSKIITTTTAMVLLFLVMIVGFWAATYQATTINASLSFTAEDVAVDIVGKVMGSAEQVTDFQQSIDPNKLNNSSFSWSIGSVSFDFENQQPIRVGVAIRNDGVDTNLYCKVSVSVTLPSGVTLKYRQTGGTSPAPYSSTVTKANFVPSLLTTLSSNASYTATSGTTLPAYNPATSTLTNSKVYYLELEFTLTDFTSDVSSFAIAFGMNIGSSTLV